VVAEFDEEFAGVGDADFVEVLEVAFAGVEFEVAAEWGFSEVEQVRNLFEGNGFLEMFLSVVEYFVDLLEVGLSHRVVCELDGVEALEAFFAQQVQGLQHGNNRDDAFAGGDGGEHGQELFFVDFKFQAAAASLEQVFDGFEFAAIEEPLAQKILVKLQADEVGFFGSLDEGVRQIFADHEQVAFSKRIHIVAGHDGAGAVQAKQNLNLGVEMEWQIAPRNRIDQKGLPRVLEKYFLWFAGGLRFHTHLTHSILQRLRRKRKPFI